MSHDFRCFRVDCVSRPAGENFAGFLHDHGDFHADCVSRSVPDYFGQGVALQRLANHLLGAHALAEPALDVVVRVPGAPIRARALVPRPLTRLVPASPLARCRARIRLKPLA